MSVTPEPEFTEWHHTDVPAVPPGWYRDAPPRTTEELIRDHLAHRFDPLGSLEAAEVVLDVLGRAIERIDSLSSVAAAALARGDFREVLSAAVLAVLASDSGASEPQPRRRPPGEATIVAATTTSEWCSRPGCERLAHRDALGHLGTDGEPVCTSAQTDHGNFTNRVCTRALGHLGHHTYVMWYGFYAQTQLDR